MADVTELNYERPPLARLNDVRADVEGGVTFGPDGSAYALQFGTTSRTPGEGSIVRRWPDGRLDTIASGLAFPTAITYGPDNNRYVSDMGH